jgi:hypothetical protein
LYAKNKKKTSTWEEDFLFFAQIHEHVWEEEEEEEEEDDDDSYITTCGEFSQKTEILCCKCLVFLENNLLENKGKFWFLKKGPHILSTLKSQILPLCFCLDKTFNIFLLIVANKC